MSYNVRKLRKDLTGNRCRPKYDKIYDDKLSRDNSIEYKWEISLPGRKTSTESLLYNSYSQSSRLFNDKTQNKKY